MGFYLAGWWMGITRLELVGQLLWRHVQPITSKLLPINNHRQAFSLGMLWGFLPCGLVYSTLSWALATANWQQSALLMLAFGLGTLPAMLVTGFASKKVLSVLRQRKARVSAALLMIALGGFTLLSPWQHAGHSNHGDHSTPSTSDTKAAPIDHSHHH
jgi:sulfite exporter TauE/SafE